MLGMSKTPKTRGRGSAKTGLGLFRHNNKGPLSKSEQRRLLRYRYTKGLTQTQLGKKVGLSQSLISNAEARRPVFFTTRILLRNFLEAQNA